MTQANNAQQQAREQFENVQQQARRQYDVTQNLAATSLRTWNQLLAISNDAAFDAALRSWNYSRSVRDSAEQALEDAVKRQREVSAEMLKVWQGYTDSVSETINRSDK